MCFETLNHGLLVDCDINLEGYDGPLKKPKIEQNFKVHTEYHK